MHTQKEHAQQTPYVISFTTTTQSGVRGGCSVRLMSGCKVGVGGLGYKVRGLGEIKVEISITLALRYENIQKFALQILQLLIPFTEDGGIHRGCQRPI